MRGFRHKEPQSDGHLITEDSVLPTTAPGGAPERNRCYQTPATLLFLPLAPASLARSAHLAPLSSLRPRWGLAHLVLRWSWTLLTQLPLINQHAHAQLAQKPCFSYLLNSCHEWVGMPNTSIDGSIRLRRCSLRSPFRASLAFFGITFTRLSHE
jgi:hypothetical protein